MKNKKLVFIICGLVILCALWGVRYHSLNEHFREMYSQNTREEYGLNELVEFGENKDRNGFAYPGYSVAVQNFEIYDRADFEAKYGVNFDDYADSIYRVPCKVAVVSIRFESEGSDVECVRLDGFVLHGVDSYFYPEFPFTNVINPSLGDAMGISVADGHQCELELVYFLHEFRLSSSVWKNIDDYKMWLNVTSYPTEKEILLQQ